MWPYWFLFGSIAWMAVTHMRPQQVGVATSRVDPAWPAFFFLLVLLIGLRHEVGADWLQYLYLVDRMRGIPLHEVWSYSDPAYALMNWFGANVAGSVYAVNTVSACIFCWGLIAFCRDQPRPWLALLVAAPYLITVVAMGYSRQGVAIGLAMLGMVSLSHRRVLRFFLWIALASVFHRSAVILVPLALFADSQSRLLKVLGVIAVGSLLFLLLLQEYLDSLVRNYIEAEYQSSGAAVRTIINTLPAILLLLFKKKFTMDHKALNFWNWMAWGAIFLALVFLISPSSTAVDRVALYWIPLQLFVWPRLPDVLGIPGRRNSTWVYFLIIYCAAIMFTWLLFSNYAYTWIPYQFYPLVLLWS